MIKNIPEIGPLTADDILYYTEPIHIPIVNRPLQFAIDLAATESDLPALMSAIINFRSLSLPEFKLRTQDAVFTYYRETYDAIMEQDPDYALEYLPVVAKPAEIWEHVTFGDQPTLQRRYPDNQWEVAWECECAWEDSHGLAIALIDGNRHPIAGDCDSVL